MKMSKMPKDIYIVTAGGELYFASTDEDEAAGYAESKLDDAINDILDENGNDDPSEQDVAFAALTAGFDGNNYCMYHIDLTGKTLEDSVETEEGDEFTVEDILDMIQ